MSDNRPARWDAARGAVVASIGLVAGMWLAFRPMLGSRFARMQSEGNDTRLNNYILEHGYRWLLGMPGHRALWSPPVFYPAPNTAAYSDVLLGVAPFYWPWRLLGFPPDTAFQLWMLAIAATNYLVALVCCRRLLRVGWVAAAFGAFVFAFGSTRLAQLRHPQLLAQFYPLIACCAIAHIFEGPENQIPSKGAPTGRPGWVVVLGASIVAQLYAGYYQGWFFLFVLGVGVVWASVLPSTRRRLLAVVRERRMATAALYTLAGSVVALLPLALPYLAAARDVGMRSYNNVTWYLPRIWSWVFMGRDSWYYSWMFRYSQFRSIPEGHEHRLGLGFVTTSLVIVGLWIGRRRPLIQLVIACGLTVICLSTVLPNGMSAWIMVYRFVPGAAAIRGVSRIALVLLIPAGAGVALMVDRWRRWPLALVTVAGFIVAEQGQQVASADKAVGRRRAAVVADAVPHQCLAFLYTPPSGRDDPWSYHVDAMWASMITGVPTINGYSGNSPPGWSFYHNVIATPANDSALSAALDGWALRWSIAPARLCRVAPAPG